MYSKVVNCYSLIGLDARKDMLFCLIKLGIQFLLFWQCLNGSEMGWNVEEFEKSSWNFGEKYEEIGCISNGIVEILAEICGKDELVGNLIIQKDSKNVQLVNEIVRKATENLHISI